MDRDGRPVGLQGQSPELHAVGQRRRFSVDESPTEAAARSTAAQRGALLGRETVPRDISLEPAPRLPRVQRHAKVLGGLIQAAATGSRPRLPPVSAASRDSSASPLLPMAGRRVEDTPAGAHARRDQGDVDRRGIAAAAEAVAGVPPIAGLLAFRKTDELGDQRGRRLARCRAFA